MWHEARKQERKIRGMLVDYRRRAERRRDFYEKIKADPTQFLQVHARQCKIYLDPAIAAAADSSTTMMPWQGHADNLIDRFDVRAHLDFIPPIKKDDDEEISLEERQLNYERFRIVAQNSFLSIGEEKFLKQLHLEEQFGYTEQHEPKKKKTGGVAIGFNYEDGTGTSQPAPQEEPQSESDDSDASDSDLDVDLAINVSKVDSAEAHEMNRHGRSFGMSTNDFYSFLTNDLEEAENFRLAKEEENEKALYSGRKSRRERRAHREKRLANRKISPPSYAAQASPTATARDTKSPSKSPSPEVSDKITYITSFGGEEEPQMPLNPTYADKVKYGNKLRKLRRGDSEERSIFIEKKHNPGSSDRYSSRRRNSRSPRRRSRSYNRSRHSSRTTTATTTTNSRYRRKPSSSSSRSSSTASSSSSSRSRRGSRLVRSRSRTQQLQKQQQQQRLHVSPRTRTTAVRSRRSVSKSRSRSRSRSRSVSRLKSRSRSTDSSGSLDKSVLGGAVGAEGRAKASEESPVKQEKVESPPKAIPRYYGRRRSDRSSSLELGPSSDENGDSKMEVDENPVSSPATHRSMSSGNSSTTAKVSSSGMSLQERLKRKRQALLNKQFKADKIAEQLKTEREKQEQQTREDELREMAIKLRRKQRERRHAYDSDSSTNTSTSSKSGTENKTPITSTVTPESSANHKSRSRSKSASRTSKGERSTTSRNRDRSTSRSRERYRDRDRNRPRSNERDRNRSDKDRDRSGKIDRADRDGRDHAQQQRRRSRSRSRRRDDTTTRRRSEERGSRRGGDDWRRDRDSNRSREVGNRERDGSNRGRGDRDGFARDRNMT